MHAVADIDDITVGDVVADAALAVYLLVLQQHMRHLHVRAVYAHQVPVVGRGHLPRTQPLGLGRRVQVGREGVRLDLLRCQLSSAKWLARERRHEPAGVAVGSLHEEPNVSNGCRDQITCPTASTARHRDARLRQRARGQGRRRVADYERERRGTVQTESFAGSRGDGAGRRHGLRMPGVRSDVQLARSSGETHGV